MAYLARLNDSLHVTLADGTVRRGAGRALLYAELVQGALSSVWSTLGLSLATTAMYDAPTTA